MADEKSIKCVVVGDGAVGKTCMLISYSTDRFPEEYVPTVFDNYKVELNVGGETHSLELWDTAGQESYDQLRPLSYSGTDIFIIVYSCVDHNSFNNVDKWYKELVEHWEDKSRAIPIILCGTKKDLLTDTEAMKKLADSGESAITLEEADVAAKRINASACMQCSSKSQEGLKAVFDKAVNIVMESRQKDVPAKGCCTIA